MHNPPQPGTKLLPYLVLAAAVMVVSTAAILIRWAQAEGVPSLTIASWRLTFAALLLTPFLALRREGRRELTRHGWKAFGGCIASGLFLAAHFASWIASLSYTSIASSTALVTTNPIWIALASWLLLREKPSQWLVLGITSAVLGSSLIFLSDARHIGSTTSANPMLGNGLAVLGSLTVCGYLLIGRKLRQQYTLMAYIGLVYASAATILMLTALLSGAALTGFSLTAWLCLAGLALGPQLLGHTGINWALKHVSASFIAIVILGEPISSALLGWLILGEQFAPLQLAGFLLLLAGIYLASRGEIKPST